MKPVNLLDALDKFYAEKTITDVNRETFLICNLKDPGKKITISLVFMKDWDVLEPSDYDQVIVQNKGAVLTFPCYWVSVPKELAIPYFEFIIDELYKNEFDNWNTGSGPSSDTGSNGSGCNCPCNQV